MGAAILRPDREAVQTRAWNFFKPNRDALSADKRVDFFNTYRGEGRIEEWGIT